MKREPAFLLFLFACLFAASAQLHAVDLIANAATATKSVSRLQVQTIFSGHSTHWKNGVEVRLIVMSEDHQLHNDFTKQYLNIYPYQLRRIWDRQNYSGIRIPVIVVSSLPEMVNTVAKIPGAIGYVPAGTDIPAAVVRLEINDRSVELPFWGYDEIRP